MRSIVLSGYEHWIIIGTFLCLSFFLQANRLNQLPKAVHPWAQSDRYALALGFLANDFNLLQPETHLLNREFPDNFKKPSKSAVTAVNFPLHEYLVALLMKGIGSRSIAVFRIYNLLFSIIGLFALFKIGRLIGLSFLSSLFVVLFLYFSPIYLIYQVSTLGIVNTLSLVFLSLYLYLLFRKRRKLLYFVSSIAVITLASLIRSTAMIPFIAVLLTEVFRSLQNRKFYLLEFVVTLAAFGLLWVHYYYMNLHMVYQHGSVFLYYLVPAKSWAEALEILQTAYELWALHYWSAIQWFLLLIFIPFGLALFFKSGQLNERLKNIGLPAFFSLGGFLLFSIAMLTKFRDHDYYVLDTFAIPIILFLIVCFRLIETQFKVKRRLFGALYCLLTIVLFVEGKNSMAHALKVKPWQNTPALIADYRQAALKMEELNIEKDAKVLVVGAEFAPNLPLILLNRKGYILRWQSKEEMQNVINWDFDYLLFRKTHFFTYYHPKWKDFINHFKLLSVGQEVVIAEPTDSLYSYSKKDFMEGENMTLWYEEELKLERPSDHWSGIYLTEEKDGKVNLENEFALTFDKKIDFETNSKISLFFSADIFSHDSLKKAEVVVTTLNQAGNTMVYKTYPLNSFSFNQNQWNPIEVNTSFHINAETHRLKLYFWNQAGESFSYKNVHLMIRKSKDED